MEIKGITLSEKKLLSNGHILHDMCVWLSHVWLFVTPWTVARQAPPSLGFSQARTLERAAIPFSRGSSQSKD